jgi:hypothetical protein
VAHKYGQCGRASLETFQFIAESTHCIFAGDSRLEAAPSWTTGGLDLHLDSVAAALAGFTERVRRDHLDGFVVGLPGDYGRRVESLAHWTKVVLNGLSLRDPVGGNELHDVERVNWEFTFADETYFVLTTGPCYPPSSSRYSFGVDGTYILLQPLDAFRRRRPPGKNAIAASAKKQIRAAYAANSRPYDLALTLSPYEAYRFVKPTEYGAPAVRWWES